MTWAAECRITPRASAIFGGEDADLRFALGRQLVIEADRFAIDLAGDGRLEQSRADGGGDIFQGDWGVEFLAAAVGKNDLEHGWEEIQSRVSPPGGIGTKDGQDPREAKRKV